MTDWLALYLPFAYPEVFTAPWRHDPQVIEALRADKLLDTAHSWLLKHDMPGFNTPDDAAHEVRRRHLEQVAVKLRERHAHLRELKGTDHAALYPSGIARYSGDLDLLYTDESAYTDAILFLMAEGFSINAAHLFQGPSRLHASTILHRKAQGATAIVEMHLNGFPVTPLSSLDIHELQARLSESVLRAVILIAEFVYRDGRHKRFTHRDMLDTLFVFEALHINDVAALSDTLTTSQLWVAVALLKQHLEAIGWSTVPPTLRALLNSAQIPEVPSPYNIYEHQAWPAQQARGLARERFDLLRSSYAEINTDEGARCTLTAFEIGARFGLGVPVAVRPRPGATAGRVLDVFQVLCGPRSLRTVVHQRLAV